MLTRSGRSLLLASLRLVIVIGLLAAFGLWWSHQKQPDFRVDLRLELQPDGDPPEPRPVRLNGQTRDALSVPAGRSLLYTLAIPGDHAVLRFHDGHLQGLPELAVSLLRAGGQREQLEAHDTTEAAWSERRVELPVEPGEDVTLELAVRDGRGRPGLGEALLADVVLESEGRGVDETEFPIRTRAQLIDLLAHFGDRRKPAPPTDESAPLHLDGPLCIPLTAEDSFFATAEQLPAAGRLDIVLHVGRLYPDGPAFPGRVVVTAGGDPIASVPLAPPENGRLAAETVTHLDLSGWNGKSVDLGLRREAAENLYVGLRELDVSGPVSVPRRSNPARRGRNVLLVVVDALRADRLGCYGHAEACTPAIDALAARGGRWDRVLAPSSWTLPNVASLFTGTPPLTHGLGLRAGRLLSPRLATLAQSAAWSGITTALFSSSPWVARATGLQQGCETVVEDRVPAPVLTERALDWLEQAQQFEWFLTVVFADPAYPYEPDPYDMGRLRGPPSAAFVESLARLDSRPGAADRVAQELGTQYDGEVAAVDRAVGMLVDWLRAHDLLQQTLIAVVGAEGEEFYDHRGRLHGQTLHDEVVRVPVVIAGPAISGANGGSFVEPDPVDLLDISKLLAGVGRLSSQGTLQGSLPPPFSPRLPDTANNALLVPFDRVTNVDLRASRSRRYLRFADGNGENEALYDLESDPQAARNLLDGPPDHALRLQADALARSLEDWQRASLAVAAAHAVPLEAGPP